MHTKKFQITIASLPDRELLVAEIFYEGIQWVEISQETGALVVQFYAHPSDEYWEFQFCEALDALEEAKKKLLDLDTPEPEKE